MLVYTVVTLRAIEGQTATYFLSQRNWCSRSEVGAEHLHLKKSSQVILMLLVYET